SDLYYSAKVPTPGKTNMRRGAFLSDVGSFDAAFFDVPPVEANRMDPQQRIFLQIAWHALEDAGLTVAALRGSETGVFVGIHGHSADYGAMQFADTQTLDGYAATGTAHDVIAGRLAYWLDLRGPSMVIDTACSSSLVAVHVACRSLRAKDCDCAVVGGLHLILSPRTSVAMSQLQMLAGDGRSKTFDSRADGFGRGEGCGVVVLKRLSDAQRDNDRILAVIRGSAVNQDGRTNGLTAPNGLAQQRLLRRAFQDSGVSPLDIGYFEAHGTGTALGDPIEVEAIAAVLGGKQRLVPCVLGSVKANIGHLEGGAGIAGLIKVVLAMRHGYFPPVAHLEKLNPHLVLDRSGLKVPVHGEKWSAQGPRLASVSSFGWSGTNAHVVLEEGPAVAGMSAPSLRLLVAVSAQAPEALHSLATAYAERIEGASWDEIADIAYTSTVHRTHHRYRIAVLGTGGQEIAESLRCRVSGSQAGASISAGLNPSDREGNQTMVDRECRLSRAVDEYEQGVEIDWKEIISERRNIVSLPQYPFQGRRYWFAETVAPTLPPQENTAPEDWYYAVDWHEIPLEKGISERGRPAVWLIFADHNGFQQRLASAIRLRGDRAILIVGDSIPSGPSRDCFALGESTEKGVDPLFRWLHEEKICPDYVVLSADGRSAVQATADALAFTQAAIRSKLNLKLWFVTEQAQPVGASAAPWNWEQAAIWGFARSCGLEYPQFVRGVIDLDRKDEQAAEPVMDAILHAGREDRIAIRQGKRFAPRLVRAAVPRMSKPLTLRPDACYLVTGAFGGIGLHLAEWLADCGARHLMLIGRRSPEQMHDASLDRRMQALRAKGVFVEAVACDIADEDRMRGLIADIVKRGQPLRGVVHAAAALPFSALSNASQQDVETAFRAKVEGARVLDRLTRKSNLDLFVLFSSAAASIGSRNGSLYAAANSCLNLLAANRAAQGLTSLSVEWGLWETTAADNQRALIARSGFRPMPPRKALDALARLVVSGAETGMVADIDWATLGSALEHQDRHAFVASVVNQGRPAHSEKIGDADVLDRLRGLAANDRLEQLQAFVGSEVKKVFGMSQDELVDESRGLADMGMDSLMSVNLQNRMQAYVGVPLPTTLVLDYPNISALARFLDSVLFGGAQELQQLPSMEPELDREIDAIAAMSDAEIDAALESELAAIRKLGVQ
ncbi:MAG TPA: SDR family NAD(P)-dependent oxidoreductase, partial [Acidobacteriaceae bacterium]|nr:SDR family NAD(P)-dependent oxidoreductase [Acidobacteriaceae bacterium]